MTASRLKGMVWRRLARAVARGGATSAGDVEAIRESGAFSAAWYARQRPALKTDPIVDYVRNGAKAGLAPHPLFDTSWYGLRYPEVAASGLNPFVDYLTLGWRAGRDPGPLFDTAWYLARHPGLDREAPNPLAHFDRAPGEPGASTTPLFDAPWYEERFGPGLFPSGTGFRHFMEHGFEEGRDPGPLFSSDWYRERHAARLTPGRPPFWHYRLVGASQDLDPGPGFDAAWYRRHALPRGAAGGDPLTHYLTDGRAAGRLPLDPAPMLGPRRIAVILHLYYADVWPQILAALRRIPFPFDLFVTCPAERRRAFEGVVRAAYPDAHVMTSVNRGRDIAPFFQALHKAEAVADYAAICKIHTKKGITEADVWRHDLLDAALGSSVLIRDIVEAFLTRPALGVVGPEGLYVSGPKFMTGNGETVGRIVRALYVNAKPPAEWGFFAGTMFWFRPALFVPLARYVAEQVVFEAANASNDGQAAHAIERTFGLVPAVAGCEVGLVRTAGEADHAGRLSIHGPGERISHEPPTRYLRRRSAELKGRLVLAG